MANNPTIVAVFSTNKAREFLGSVQPEFPSWAGNRAANEGRLPDKELL